MNEIGSAAPAVMIIIIMTMAEMGSGVGNVRFVGYKIDSATRLILEVSAKSLYQFLLK